MDWAFDLTGRVRKIGKRPVKIEEQLAEETNPNYAQRHVLAHARYLDTNQEILLKIRYDLRPEAFEIEDVEENREEIEELVLDEIEALNAAHEIGHGPGYLDHLKQRAGKMFPYPDGLVWFIVMTRVKGENVADIYRFLSFEDLEIIRHQLAHILEHLRKKGLEMMDENPCFLRFDEEEKKLYLFDFTSITLLPDGEPDIPITADDWDVLCYDIWSDDHLQKVMGFV